MIGDPLAAPFRTRTLNPDDIDRGLDRNTELPPWFSARSLEALGLTASGADAGRLLLRARSRLTRADPNGALEALEQATALDARLFDAQLMLAALYDQTGNIDKAIARYRQVVSLDPKHVGALNNLAYALATTRHDALPEALTLAQKANTLSPNSPSILDTLAWILHLSGDDFGARTPMGAALRLSPNNAQLLVHAGLIEASLGNLAQAGASLKQALTINPAIQSQPEVQQLQKAVQARPQP